MYGLSKNDINTASRKFNSITFSASGEAHGAHWHGIDAEGSVALGVKEGDDFEGFALGNLVEGLLNVDPVDVAAVGWRDCHGVSISCL